jgi:hypothetical protein
MGLFRRSKRTGPAVVTGDVAMIPAPAPTTWMAQAATPSALADPPAAAAPPAPVAPTPAMHREPIAVTPSAPTPMFSYGDAPAARADTGPSPGPVAAPDGDLTAVMARLERLEVANARLRADLDQASAVNAELVSTLEHVALANDQLLATVHQLELRLDTPMDAPTTDVPTIATVADLDELRAGQVRLANEQARYEIAFRADLAELAERCRRSA